MIILIKKYVYQLVSIFTKYLLLLCHHKNVFKIKTKYNFLND